MALTPSYYISALATPGVGNGTLGNPYALADLSTVGGTYKTVTTGDVIAAIADGTYTMAATWLFPSWSGSVYTVLRGCKVDGSFDETLATRAVFTTGAYMMQFQNGGCLADVKLQNPATGATAQVYFPSNGDFSIAYNVECVYGTGSGSIIGIYGAPGADRVSVISCRVTGAFTNGILMSGSCGVLHCIVNGTSAAGISVQAMNATGSLVAHCISRGVTAGVGFAGAPVGHTIFAYNTAFDNFSDGFGVDNCPCIGNIAAYNGGYGYNVTGAGTNRHLGPVYKNVSWNNTSGASTGADTWNTTQIFNEDPWSGSTPTTDLTPTNVSIQSLSSLLDAAAGGNLAGAITPAGSGPAPSGGGSTFSKSRLINTGGF